MLITFILLEIPNLYLIYIFYYFLHILNHLLLPLWSFLMKFLFLLWNIFRSFFFLEWSLLLLWLFLFLLSSCLYFNKLICLLNVSLIKCHFSWFLDFLWFVLFDLLPKLGFWLIYLFNILLFYWLFFYFLFLWLLLFLLLFFLWLLCLFLFYFFFDFLFITCLSCLLVTHFPLNSRRCLSWWFITYNHISYAILFD